MVNLYLLKYYPADCRLSDAAQFFNCFVMQARNKAIPGPCPFDYDDMVKHLFLSIAEPFSGEQQ
jgi:hypothetical protein